MRLTVVHEGRTLDRYEFPDDKRILVGRHEDCEVSIDFQGISRQHCEIVRVGDAHVLRDLRSSNGTYVRGERIREHSLSEGDVFSVVGYKITYEGAPRQVQASSGSDVGSMADLTLRVNPKAIKGAAAVTSTGAQVSRVNGHLVVEEGAETRTVILQQSVFQVGKEPQADLLLTGFLAPRLAAVIVRDASSFWLLDVSPKGNCVTVNGARTRAHELVNADMIQVYGAVRFQYYDGLPRLEVDRQLKKGEMLATKQMDVSELRRQLGVD